VHVTARLRAGLPSLRRDAERRVLEHALSRGAARFGFRLTQYSIQSNHAHLIAEASDRRALWRGVQGLLVRIAKALNKLWSRRGRVFGDRYHARHLKTPREVRAALLYVLQNARRHGVRVLGIDRFSSGPWFDGWKQRVAATRRSFPGVEARVWLLRVGWRRHGLIGVEEVPRRRQAPRYARRARVSTTLGNTAR
jgi:REP element-mobilizing transposase RayT